MNGGQPWSLRQCAGAVKFVLVRFRREMDLGTRLTTKARRSRRRTKKIRATDTETQSWQRVARRRIAAARACGRAETQTPSAIGLRFRPSSARTAGRLRRPACDALRVWQRALRTSVSPCLRGKIRGRDRSVTSWRTLRASLRALRSLRSTFFSVSPCLRGKIRGRNRSVTSCRTLRASLCGLCGLCVQPSSLCLGVSVAKPVDAAAA